jgi:hypothetical protein
LFGAHPPFGGVEVWYDGDFAVIDWSGHDRSFLCREISLCGNAT